MFQSGQNGKQRPQFVMAVSPLALDYMDEMDFRKREAINEAAIELETRGLLEVRWRKFQSGQFVEKIYLLTGEIAAAYELANVKPRREKLEVLRRELGPLADHPWEWVRHWQAETDALLACGKNGGLDPDNPEGCADLTRALTQLPRLTAMGPLPRRVFSQKIFCNSKQFEVGAEKLLLSIVRRYTDWDLDTDEAYLENIGLLIQPKLALFAGGIIFSSATARFEYNRLTGVVGLSMEALSGLTIEKITALRIISVENLTSFYQLTQELPAAGEVLVIYSGGFPNGATQALYRSISEHVAGKTEALLPEIYHWGDMDYGGIRIFQHLKERFFQRLLPLCMDLTTYEEYFASGSDFDAKYREKLRDLLVKPEYASWTLLIQEMLRLGRRIEQEVVRPKL